jgi:pimeloyl-ACP methyl ester carboxylesterase
MEDQLAERMIEVNGVEVCTEAFDDPGDPPVLLVMGIGASMLWWEEGFCRLLAEGGRLVIRYDHRDTGRSVTYEPGCAEYTGADLVDDAVDVLDAYAISAAHVVGVSAGGAFAQLLALAFPERALSLVLISTSPATPHERQLPQPTESFRRFMATAEVDWSDRDSIVDYLVGYSRMLAGGERPFDEADFRELVRRDVERARSIAASANHASIAEGEPPDASLSSIAVPTLVIHGTADPMFPFEHGRALAEEVPGARLLTLARAGHGIDRADWATIVRAILEPAPREIRQPRSRKETLDGATADRARYAIQRRGRRRDRLGAHSPRARRGPVVLDLDGASGRSAACHAARRRLGRRRHLLRHRTRRAESRQPANQPEREPDDRL